MVMLRPAGKALKISKEVMKKKGVKVTSPDKKEKLKLTGPYLQH